MASKNKNLGPLTFGLDIGIASVGWAVLGENRIIDLGVRCFDKAETADKGESLNLARRMAGCFAAVCVAAHGGSLNWHDY